MRRQQTADWTKSISWRGFLLAAFLVCVPALAHADRIRVVATTTDVGSVLREVGGDRVRVEILCKGYQDPHYLEAKPSFIVDLRKADLLAYVGLQLEIGWLPLLVEGARNRDLAVGGKGNLFMGADLRLLEIPTSPVSRALGDVHPEGNPHYWLDPHNLIRMAHAAQNRLTYIDPEAEGTYAANLRTFVARLEEAIPIWEQKMARHRGRAMICYHKNWEYIADWLGLEIAEYVENRPGIPPSPRHWQDLGKRMEARKIRVLLAAVFVQSGQLESMAERVGAELVILPPSVGGAKGVDDLFALFDLLTTELAAAFDRAGA